MIRADTKRVVRSLYLMRCGYCGVSERDIGAELTYDHFQPQSRGGMDDASNIVYACHACNEFKGDYWSVDQATCLLHPLNETLGNHLQEEADGTLTALTERGRIYLDQLHLNRPPLVAYRQERIGREQAAAERRSIQQALEVLLQRLQNIEEKLKQR